MRPTHEQLTVIEKIVTHSSPQRGYTMPHGATCGSTRIYQEAEEARGKHDPEQKGIGEAV